MERKGVCHVLYSNQDPANRDRQITGRLEKM